MFNKKKKQAPETETVSTPETESVKFEKNIKVLWIYTTLFCLFALALIVVSSVIQGRMNSKAEYYQEQFENAQTSGHSALQNIQDENAALKRDLEMYKNLYEQGNVTVTEDEVLIDNAVEAIECAEILLECQKEIYTGSYTNARDLIKGIDKKALSGSLLEYYNSISELLGE